MPKLHTGLKNRRLKIFCFPPEFEMKFHIYFAPSAFVVVVVMLLFGNFKRTKLICLVVLLTWTINESALPS